jgi:hypothetical protein
MTATTTSRAIAIVIHARWAVEAEVGVTEGVFDLEHTQLRHAERLEPLLLAAALATVWSHEFSEGVLQAGEDARREIDPTFMRSVRESVTTSDSQVLREDFNGA